jgi:hypothetical protein
MNYFVFWVGSTPLVKKYSIMILHSLFLGIGLIFAAMGSTEDTEDVVRGCYEEQQRLEMEEQEKLLAKEPGEPDDDGTTPRPDILDVTMEDEQPPTQQSPPPQQPPPPPPLTETGAVEQLSRNVTQSRNSNSSGSETSGSNANTKPNPKVGGTGTKENNKQKLYLAAKRSAAATFLPNLFGGGSKVAADCGSFLIDGDARFDSTTVRSDISTGVNITYSFNPDAMLCQCCRSLRRGGEGVVWVFSDQNFPPILPAGGG